MTRLEGRVVAVAGVGGSLGAAVLGRFAAAGAMLAATDLAADRLDALGRELGLGDDRWHAEVVDLLDRESARRWADGIAQRFGRVDAVAHLVGGWRGGKGIDDGALEDWDALEGPLVRTVQHTSVAFLPHLKAAGDRGRFAIVSSMQAQRPTPTNAAYAAAKAAAEAWTLALAGELAETRGTANVVVVNAIGDAKPSFTPPEHLAEALELLCSDAGSRMNGQRLSLHG